MARFCTSCGSNLSRLDRLLGRSACGKCRSAEAELRREAAERYPVVVRGMFASGAEPDSAAEELRAARTQAALSDTTALNIHKRVFQDAVLEALADDILSEEEEGRLARVGETLGITQHLLQTEFRDLVHRLLVARTNDGRMPVLSSPGVILKKDEVAHIEVNASLMKEVTVREWRGGYRGVSFRIARGVRYHVGGARGKSVVVGTELKEVDHGILTLTSKRSVFQGSKTTIEMPHTKLVNLQVFTDGVQFHMSNRKNPPLFQVESGDVVAAVVNVAAQRLLE